MGRPVRTGGSRPIECRGVRLGCLGYFLASSNGFARTKKEQETFPAETADDATLVQIAIAYRGQQEMHAADARQFGVKVCCSPDGEEQTVIYCDAVEKKLAVDTNDSIQ